MTTLLNFIDFYSNSSSTLLFFQQLVEFHGRIMHWRWLYLQQPSLNSYKGLEEAVLTNGSGLVALPAEVAGIADALPGLVAVTVDAVPVRDALSAVVAGPALAADAGVGHHAHALQK